MYALTYPLFFFLMLCIDAMILVHFILSFPPEDKKPCTSEKNRPPGKPREKFRRWK